VLIGALLLAACGKSGTSGAEASQVVATINKTELTTHQLQYLISRNPAAAANSEKPEVARQALDKLVDDEIAAQRAISDGADKQDKFIYATDNMRREILSQLAFEKIAASIGKPSADEIKTFYYETYPLMFKDRHVYLADELVFGEAGVKVLEADVAAGALPLESALKKLTGADAEFRHEVVAIHPEDIPLGTIAKLGSWTARVPLPVPMPGYARLLFLRSSEASPVKFEAARPRIERFLTTQHWNETRQRILKEWRGEATVTLASRFTEPPAPAPAAPAPAEPKPEAKPSPLTPAESAEPGSAEKKPLDPAIRKGIDSLR